MVLMRDAIENAQHRRPTSVHADLLGRVIVEDKCADPISLMEYSPRSEGGDLCSNYRLHRNTAAKEHVDALVHHQDGRTIPFFRIDTHVWLAHPCRHAPVD